MDGCGWTCNYNTGSCLFVNENYHQVGDERTFSEFGIEYEGSDFAHRGTLGLSIHTAH
jgi:hypothetical protein